MQDIQYLSVVALGENNIEFLKDISQLFSHHKCEIVHTHIIPHAELYSINFLLSGKWNVLAKIEIKLKALAQQFSYDLLLKQSSSNPQKTPSTKNMEPDKSFSTLLPYTLYIISLTNTDTYYQLMRFLYLKNVIITEIVGETYQTRRNLTTMTAVNIKIQLSSHISISDWRENFMLFCDDMNLDAVMEPDKG